MRVREDSAGQAARCCAARDGGCGDGAERAADLNWSQDAVRRAYESMLKSQSHDLLVLARVALQGAIRSEADLLALLPAEPPQTHSAKAPAASAVVDAA